MEVCLVYLKRIEKEKADFASLVPGRVAQIMSDDADIYVLYSGYINKDRLNAKGVNCYTVPKVSKGVSLLNHIIIMYMASLIGVRHDIDVFQNVWSHHFMIPLRIASWISGSRLVARVAGVTIRKLSATVRGPWYFGRWMRNVLGRSVEWISLWSADHIQAVSRSLKETFVDRGIQPQHISVISQGCDTDHFRPSSPVHKRETKRILYVGRLTDRKGIGDLIRGFSKLLEGEHPSAQLLVAGEGEDRPKYVDLAEDLGIADCVHFCGYVDHDAIVELYNSSRVFVLPSRSEGLPNVLLEAMACGLPCVATPVGEIPKLLAEGRGIMVPVGEPQRICQAVTRLLTNSKDVKGMSKKARQYVIERHSLDSIRSEYIDLYSGN
jgi:glycosyltransferase involved in cell wall biosynthesis